MDRTINMWLENPYLNDCIVFDFAAADLNYFPGTNFLIIMSQVLKKVFSSATSWGHILLVHNGALKSA